jgi:hypothetical protein
MSSKINYKFSTGLEVNGTVDEIATIAKSLGLTVDYTKFDGKIPKGYYPSESKGLVKISEMTDYHIRRALLKRAKDYLSTVYEAKETNKKFLEKFLSLAADPTIEALFNELQKRK